MGSLIAGTFGLVYVLVNTDRLAQPLPVALRTAAMLALVAVVATLVRHRPAGASRARSGDPAEVRVLVRRYGTVVSVEAVAIVVGCALLVRVLGLPDAGVAWVSVVVGVHLLPLARVLHVPAMRGVGTAIGAAGAVGLAVVLAGGPGAVVDVVAGVVPGALLLGAAWWGARHDLRADPTTDTATDATTARVTAPTTARATAGATTQRGDRHHAPTH